MSKSNTITPGSIWIELALWLLFFPAGIIYSIWRHTQRREVVAGIPKGRSGERNYREKQPITWETEDGEPPKYPTNKGDTWLDRLNMKLYLDNGMFWEEIDQPIRKTR